MFSREYTQFFKYPTRQTKGFHSGVVSFLEYTINGVVKSMKAQVIRPAY